MDLKAPGSYTVRLGSSILNPPKAGGFTSIRYNHKPNLQAPEEVKHTLRRTAADAEEETLVVRDVEDEYEYAGRAASNRGWYVLVRKDEGQEKVTVLERVGAIHDFNLTKTPSEDTEAKLAAQFQQLPIEDDNGLFGDNDDESVEPVDASNPWDYRNYVKQPPSKAKARADRDTYSVLQASATPRAANSTPAALPAKASQGPLLTQTKRKAPASSKADHKRVKAGADPVATSAQAPPRRMPNVPQVRIDRKASIRRSSIDDSGELILENETPVTEKPPRRTGAMALALAGQLGQGPISLRSAASSPASRVASPMPLRPDGMDEGEEFEFGESPEQISKRGPKRAEDDYFGNGDDAGEEDDADADADVEDLELPSPAQTHRKSVSAATVTGTLDDEDDLDKQLALAMAEDDDAAPPARPAESDEESEEE